MPKWLRYALQALKLQLSVLQRQPSNQVGIWKTRDTQEVGSRTRQKGTAERCDKVSEVVVVGDRESTTTTTATNRLSLRCMCENGRIAFRSPSRSVRPPVARRRRRRRRRRGFLSLLIRLSMLLLLTQPGWGTTTTTTTTPRSIPSWLGEGGATLRTRSYPSRRLSDAISCMDYSARFSGVISLSSSHLFAANLFVLALSYRPPRFTLPCIASPSTETGNWRPYSSGCLFATRIWAVVLPFFNVSLFLLNHVFWSGQTTAI